MPETQAEPWFPDSSYRMYQEMLLNAREREYSTTLKVLKAFPEDQLEFRSHEMDMGHHRGQFSVYLRMAGGKVPSIYGSTADEPWT